VRDRERSSRALAVLPILWAPVARCRSPVRPLEPAPDEVGSSSLARPRVRLRHPRVGSPMARHSWRSSTPGAVGRPPGSLASALRQSTNRLAKPERSRYVGARPPLMHQALLFTLLAVLGGRPSCVGHRSTRLRYVQWRFESARHLGRGGYRSSGPHGKQSDRRGGGSRRSQRLCHERTLSRIDAASLTQVGSRIDVGGNVCPQPPNCLAYYNVAPEPTVWP
jgi:hypothetical protein